MFRIYSNILQKTKIKLNRAFASGSSVWYTHKPKFNLLAISLSLFLVGSCNESATIFDFSKKPSSLVDYSKADLVRYGYALQQALLKEPADIKKLNAQEVKLVLASPDFARKDGRQTHWQYRSKACVMDVFLKGKNNAKVSYYDIRQRRSVLDGTQEIADPVEWQCVQSIIQERRRDIAKGFSDIYADLSLKAHKS